MNKAFSTLGFAAGLWLLHWIVTIIRARIRITKLRGPHADSWLFGVYKILLEGDSGALYENWAKSYGPIFQIPGPMGEKRTVLMDPKAIAHYFSKSNTYIKHSLARKYTEVAVGRSVVWAIGNDHKRQRKLLNPSFHNASIRDLVSIFYESGYKAKTAWDNTISESDSEEAIIEVQKWMNCISLDSIGIAAFDHDFGALRGENGIVQEGFELLNTMPPLGFDGAVLILGSLFPVLLDVPTKRQVTMKKVNQSMQKIAKDLFQRTKRDVQAGIVGTSSRSIIGALLRAEGSNEESAITEKEALDQMKALMLAGYETTSISMTWALIELALHQEKQNSLRNELSDFANGEDATYDQLMNELPYLDAVLRETLRIHPPVDQSFRVAAHEDTIHLREPITTASGKVVDHIKINAGTPIIVPIRTVNRSEAIWGPDAKEFKPERWLCNEVGLTPTSKELPGYHHILSFSDGARVCLGKLFAVAEFKAVLSVLIRNFIFEMRDGPETNINTSMSFFPRPYVVGEPRSAVPMRVRRVGSK